MFTRAAIVLLLVLNLGAAAWWLLHASPVAEAPARPANAPTLQLLAEVPAARIAMAQPQSRPQPQSQPPASSDPSQCDGPEDATRGWRVYLPRLPTSDAAQALATRIGAAGFSDYLVMRDGDDANAIALGSYGTRDAAQRRVAALQAAGFPARCARIPASTPA
jgi:hypothetical protein